MIWYFFLSVFIFVIFLYALKYNVWFFEPSSAPPSTPIPSPTFTPIPSPTFTPTTIPTFDTIPDADMELMNLLNKHRVDNLKLEPIPINKDAWKVAITHNWDLSANNTGWSGRGQSGCSAHSWSNQPGKWSGCCYNLTKTDGNCMWVKPKEITGNTKRGYEIGSGGGKRSPSGALNMWLGSNPHKEVIENTGMWSNKKWTGFGCSVGYNQQGCWFLD